MHSHSPGMQTFMSSRSNMSPNISLIRTSPYADTEPVYGDPKLYYNSPRQRNLARDF